MEPKKTKWQSFWELVRFVALALIIVLPIRWFIFSSYVVSGNSMVPTFQNGNYLIIDKISYRMGDPQRDDVVVFRYPNDTTKFYIKRIIGLPGETIDVKSRENKVTIIDQEHPNGFQLNQTFVKNIGGIDARLILKNDEYFVMGDNRSGSSDSRYWGAVKRNLLTGRALLRLRLWPINNLVDVLPGQYK
ncbi:signal peptidase I [Candidatus Nomurabacteria bacterium RIFCSPHIGHO2_01_FULL_39_10]|uniref:Signal peptidase I n=1 Tax=Candidatus Nomurabacteria bacterium RIFCSPHIGHO2_01_FULL_39_10 TaxID=1801733 RepID=A0A1F6V380_9BACT|nr:MAG: signal peptidase I [Candidatus Nomurabacteria bacterium RIFCSPHIGHO2_01_FULL_39_10]